MENLFRFSNYVGPKKFKVIFLHKKLETDDINVFVDRNENILFHINSKITSNDCTTWFVIEREKTEHKFLTYRYKYIGSILNGLDLFLENVFTEDGQYKTDKIFSLPSKKACRWCEFNQTEYCLEGVK